MGFNFKRNKNLVLKEKFTLTNFDADRGVADILAKYESQNAQLNSFEKIKEKIEKEAIVPNKTQNHLNWSKSVRERG
jgi:hypothetical protein